MAYRKLSELESEIYIQKWNLVAWETLNVRLQRKIDLLNLLEREEEKRRKSPIPSLPIKKTRH